MTDFKFLSDQQDQKPDLQVTKEIANWIADFELLSQDEKNPGVKYEPARNAIKITGVIGSAWRAGPGFLCTPAALSACLERAQPDYTLEINSPGGHVFAAAEMISNLIRQPPKVTVVTGLAASGAAVIMLTAPHRLAGSDLSNMMFHAPYGMWMGNAAEFEEYAKTLRELEAGWLDFITRKVPMAGGEKIKAAFDEGKDLRLTAKAAVENGILTGFITDEGAPVVGAPAPADPAPADPAAVDPAAVAPVVVAPAVVDPAAKVVLQQTISEAREKRIAKQAELHLRTSRASAKIQKLTK